MKEEHEKDDFPTLLKRFRARIGKSRSQLGHQANVDPSYITRLEAGDRHIPSSHIVDALALHLRLGPIDWDRFRVSAGYTPRAVEQLGMWEDCLGAVAGVLLDESLTDETREEFRAIIWSIAERWRSGAERKPKTRTPKSLPEPAEEDRLA